MTGVFDDQYAAAYDAVYSDKDYAGECDALESLIGRFGDGGIRRLLDLGCGTGRHAVHFAQRGFQVLGVDRSEAMLVHAHQRARASQLCEKVDFLRGDARDFSSGDKFDAVLMNFNVLGYMLTNDDVIGALKSARGNVRDGGLLIADFWYGPAVVVDPPGTRRRQIEGPDGPMVRTSSGEHFPRQQSCAITISVGRMKGGRLVDETEEVHRVRYFFPLELEMLLRCNGFRLQALTGFPEVETPPSEQKWVAALVAAAQ